MESWKTKRFVEQSKLVCDLVRQLTRAWASSFAIGQLV
jgi:hypothetical protein